MGLDELQRLDDVDTRLHAPPGHATIMTIASMPSAMKYQAPYPLAASRSAKYTKVPTIGPSMRPMLPSTEMKMATAVQPRPKLASGLTCSGVSEIAFSWGFNDAAHFSRSFREQFGLAPREWRQQSMEHALR